MIPAAQYYTVGGTEMESKEEFSAAAGDAQSADITPKARRFMLSLPSHDASLTFLHQMFSLWNPAQTAVVA